MRQIGSITPSNSLILVTDRVAGIVPVTMNGQLVSATSSCIAVGTRSECDGDTSILLTNSSAPSGVGDEPVFDGVIDTPSRILAIKSVLNEVFLELDVQFDKTHVQIWVNDAIEPDVITIVIVSP